MIQQWKAQPYTAAPQADGEPIDESGQRARGLADGRRRRCRRLSAFSEAVQGMSSALLVVRLSAIHNHRLSIDRQALPGACAVCLWSAAHISLPACICTRVPRGSGTLLALRHQCQGVHAGEWREPPAGCNLDGAGYTCDERRQGGWTRVLRIPSRRLGPFRTPGPVKVGSRNVSSSRQCAAGASCGTPCAQFARGGGEERTGLLPAPVVVCRSEQREREVCS
jgi:hypothetical protein